MEDNLYVNVKELFVLIDCMSKLNKNRYKQEAFDEVESVIMDLTWKEINDDKDW